MRAIINRLRRLENATAPAGRERAAVEAVLAARPRRLGASYEPLSFPPDSYAGCRTVADHILRARKLRMERQAVEARGLGAPTEKQE
jgi:hypothetical protein